MSWQQQGESRKQKKRADSNQSQSAAQQLSRVIVEIALVMFARNKYHARRSFLIYFACISSNALEF